MLALQQQQHGVLQLWQRVEARGTVKSSNYLSLKQMKSAETHRYLENLYLCTLSEKLSFTPVKLDLRTI